MNLTELPYFYYGSAIPNLNKSDYCQYGLYNPVANCFVLVHSNFKLLTILSKLFSSRYTLILCKLDTADNFSENLIDNQVCYNWTIDDLRDTTFTQIPNFNREAYLVKKLKLVTSSLDPQDLLVQDQPYFHFALSWIEYFGDGSPLNLVEFPIDVLGFDPKKFQKEIYTVIYKTFEFNKAKDNITKINKTYGNIGPNLHIGAH